MQNLSQKAELDFLKQEQKQHLLEHKRAFQKEVNIIKNDFYYKFMDAKPTKWFFDISYQPMEYLSGDSYSIRIVNDDEVFLFIIDAMGKGLSASITSMISASFLNHLVDEQKAKNSFYLEYTVKKYIRYIQSTMFNEEIISASFIMFEPKCGILTYAMFGTPPILLCDKEKNITKIKNNNLPITKYQTDININQHKLFYTQKLLIYSDGLNENITNDSNLYANLLENDFKNALNYKDFLNITLKQTTSINDDVTFFYIEKESTQKHKIQNIIIKSQYNQINNTIDHISNILHKEGFLSEEINYTINALSEVLQNSYEHGNLQIGYNKKCELLKNGTFENYLKQQEKEHGEKEIKINIFFTNDDVKTITIEIEDSGNGFDTQILKNNFLNEKNYNGRGLKIIKKMIDGYYYNNLGNKVIIKKFQKKEKTTCAI